ncbi:MAG TPA: FAD-dependent oxidoreductase [Methanocorpusculum sp.]|nr:FAD-dependent oxidoreductase [Methanocorpusculum sp.]
MQKDVEVYTLPSCPRSKKVKAFLAEQGVKYANFNVEADNKAFNRMVKLTDQYNVPVTVIGDMVILGADLDKIAAALAPEEENIPDAGPVDFSVFEDGAPAPAPVCEAESAQVSEPAPKPEPVLELEPEPEPELPPEECELIVLGCGAAGLAAAFYAGRRGIYTIVISDKNGGITASRRTVAEYPGVMEISGGDLMTNMCAQAQNAGARFIEDAPRTLGKTDDGRFLVETAGGAKFIAKAVIAAPGSRAAPGGAEGEAEYIGRGLAFCPVSEAEVYAGKNVAVFGEGGVALESAAVLAEYAKEVHVITQSTRIADAGAGACLKVKENIVYHHGFTVKSVGGKDGLEYAVIQKLENRLFGGTKKLRLDALVLCTGFAPDTALFAEIAELNEAGEIVTDGDGKTSCEGLFAAGSATSEKAKGVAVSVGSGAKAAFSAAAYIRK